MSKSMITSSFLWFDFVINRNKLLEHLKQENPVPDPSTLLVQFIENAEKYTAVIAQRTSNPLPTSNNPSIEQACKVEDAARNAKVRVFKSMALQLAAYLNWDLGEISTLPYGVQHALMRYASEYIDQNEFLFSAYNRWILRSCQIPLKKPYQQDPVIESLNRTLTPDISLQELFPLLPDSSKPPSKSDQHKPVLVPTYLTFSGNEPDFTIGEEIQLQQFHSILHAEIGIYLLYQGNAPAAAEHFKQSQLPADLKYFPLPKHKLDGYHRAAGMVQTDPESPEDTSDLKSIEFARLLRTGAMSKIKRLVGISGEPSAVQSMTALNPDERDPPILAAGSGDSLFHLQQRLLEVQDLKQIKEILVKLHALNASLVATGKQARSFHTLFTHVEIPIPVQHVLVNKFPPGPLQDYVFVLAAKAKQFLGIKQYKEARTALEMARFELSEQILALTPQERAAHIQNKHPYYHNINKLLKILEWELILIDLCDLFENWTDIMTTPSTGSKKYIAELSQRCKEIIHTSFHLNNANDVIPRSEVIETIVMALLNMGEYGFIIEQGLTKWPFLEFLSLLAKVCQDLVDRKDSSSNYRELWYAVLPIFSNAQNLGSSGGKSGKSGGTAGGQSAPAQQKNSGLVSSRTVLMWVIDRAHSQLLISLFVSILARFHNHIQENVTLQIHSADFLHIWPNILDDVTTSSEMKSRASGSSKLNEAQIFDVLILLLNRVQNNESSWLKCIGDVYLAANEPSQAMKAYLEYFFFFFLLKIVVPCMRCKGTRTEASAVGPIVLPIVCFRHLPLGGIYLY